MCARWRGGCRSISSACRRSRRGWRRWRRRRIARRRCARYVDELLASPAYGERWAAPWLDLARYADSKGYEDDRLRDMWRYRDWVIDALNADMPYDQFVDRATRGRSCCRTRRDEQLIATAFHRNTPQNDEGGTDDEEFRTYAVLDRVNTTFDAMQGTTHRLRAMPRASVRSVRASRVLRAGGVLQQHGGRRPRRPGADAELSRARRCGEGASAGAARSRRRRRSSMRRLNADADKRRRSRPGCAELRAGERSAAAERTWR